MSEIGADFGIVLAYIVPGFLFLLSVVYSWNNALTKLFRNAIEGEQRALTLFFLAVICLAIGMFLSMIRAGTIDHSFKLKLPDLLCALTSVDACGIKQQVLPDFQLLACDGIREAFLLAESRFKRPYQFYGDMVVAVVLAALVFALRFRIWVGRVGRLGFALLVVSCTIGVFAFYSAERLAHYRYTVAVQRLNELRCESTEKTPLHRQP
jgi:hypothetical protein